MAILSEIIPKVRENIEIVICGGLLFLLLFRNPFSLRTQIANFAPAPDAFYYIVPARSLVEGKGPFMVREGRSFSPEVPPLYSFVLAPIFLIKDDPRMFYFVNVFLAFSSFFLFALILRLLFPGKRQLHFLLLLLFVSNSVFYWFPTLAMAENLSLPLILMCLYLLFSKPTGKRAALFGFFLVCLYATKYVNIPLLPAFALLYCLRLCSPLKTFFRRRILALIFIFSASLTFLVFGGYEVLVLGHRMFFNPITTLVSLIAAHKEIIGNAIKNTTGDNSVSLGQNAWYSSAYIKINLPFYLKMLLGQPTVFLWEVRSVILPFFAFLSWCGVMVGLFTKNKFVAFSILVLIAAQIGFLSTFYSSDGRYLMTAVPILLLGLGIFCNWIMERWKRLGALILILFSLIVMLSSVFQYKKDIMLNLKYAETPWWYIAVLELNKTIETQIPKLKEEKIVKEPYVITPMYPYLIDFFSNGKYKLMPLSSQQEFRSVKPKVWGNFDYENLDITYLSLIQQGNPLYVANYGIGHEAILINAFNHLQKVFRLEEISSGCYNLCKVYRVWPLRKALKVENIKN